MDLHFATEKVASLKDAALRYLVIVAGILTALALSQWTESRHHAQQGAQALSDIEDEMRRNDGSLTRALARQDKQLAQLAAAEDRLGKDSFAVPDLEARARAVLKDITLEGVGDFNLVALQRSAWDAAIAGQSLQWVPKENTVRMARTYAAMQEVTGLARQVSISAASFNNVIAIDIYDRGESHDALRFARALREHRLTLLSINGGYRVLQQTMREALGAAAAVAGAASGASPGAASVAGPAAPSASASVSASVSASGAPSGAR